LNKILLLYIFQTYTILVILF